MSGRPLCSEQEAIHRGFGGPGCARRRQVLHETITAFVQSDHYHRLAQSNLARWRAQSNTSGSEFHLEVLPGDWGEVTRVFTQTYGECFAVLNMANAWVPGGAYVEGAVAQEENMFRRTNCHFEIEHDDQVDRYHPEMTRLLTAQNGKVYLDTEHPRVCIRGPEDRSRSDLGYPWLEEHEVFPFFELRAAAQDLRDGSEFDPLEARKRISAQLNTLRQHGVRHVIFGAFGCGAFRNPARSVAQIYLEEITACSAEFSVIAFAIYSAGYGPDNFTPFAEILRTSPTILP